MDFQKNNQLNSRNNRLNWFDNKVNQVKQLQTLFKNHEVSNNRLKRQNNRLFFHFFGKHYFSKRF